MESSGEWILYGIAKNIPEAAAIRNNEKAIKPAVGKWEFHFSNTSRKNVKGASRRKCNNNFLL